MTIVRWGVDWLSEVPVREEFVRETRAAFIKKNGTPRSKRSEFVKFYSTKAEALDAIRVRREREDEQRRVQRIKEAGPELLAALEALLEESSTKRMRQACCSADLLDTQPMAAARLLIAKAKGETA